MSSRQLLFEDLIGNIPELKSDIRKAALSRGWDPDWSVNLEQPNLPEQLASINIYIKFNNREFYRELIIFKTPINPLSPQKQKGFTIQWGFVPHPVIPIIHDWLNKIDTSAERVLQRNRQIKHELIETALHPDNRFIDGI